MTSWELIHAVVADVAAETGNSPVNLLNKDKRPHVARARSLALWVIRAVFGTASQCSYPRLARMFSFRDHTAALKAVAMTEIAIQAERQWEFVVGGVYTMVSVKELAERLYQKYACMPTVAS